MHNHDNKYPAQPGFEPGTSRLQAPVDANGPSRPAFYDVPRTEDVGHPIPVQCWVSVAAHSWFNASQSSTSHRGHPQWVIRFHWGLLS